LQEASRASHKRAWNGACQCGQGAFLPVFCWEPRKWGGYGEEGFDRGCYLAVAFGVWFLPGTKHGRGEPPYSLGTFSLVNLNHPQLLQVQA
jgi:hypothetical protein